MIGIQPAHHDLPRPRNSSDLDWLDDAVLLAAGPWTRGGDGIPPLPDQIVEGLDAIVTKTVTLEARAGNPSPAVARLEIGHANWIGLRNPGVADFLEHDLPRYLRQAPRVIVSIAGDPPSLAQLIEILDARDEVCAFELNVSCPNVAHEAHSFAEHVTAATQVCRVGTGKPLLVKLPPLPTTIAELGRAAVAAGADALVATNSLPVVLQLDPAGENRLCALSGATLRPVAQRCVHELAAALAVPIVGCGGVDSVDAARAFRRLGACAVQVGSAILDSPSLPATIANSFTNKGAQMTTAHTTSTFSPMASVSPATSTTVAQTIDELQRERDSLLCLGLDPALERLPSHLTGSPAERVGQFCDEIIDATADLVCAYKLNAAFFERLGSDGWRVLEATIARIPAEVPVILDAKRGDIGSSSLHYATAAFETLGADAITASPFLGLDSVAAFTGQRGMTFVLASTSNPGAGWLQDASVAQGDGSLRPVWLEIAHAVSDLQRAGNDVGLVAGATRPDRIREIRRATPDLLLLVPGVGEQNGDVSAVLAAGANADGRGLLISASRSLIFASAERDFASACRSACSDLVDQIRDAQRAGDRLALSGADA